MAESKIYWIQKLDEAINQAIDPALAGNSESSLLKNISLDQVGNWCSRRGTDKLGSTTAGSERVWGLHTYDSTAGVHSFLRVANRDLELFNGTDTWSIVDTDEFTASRKVNFVNFLNRAYCGQQFVTGDTSKGIGYTTGGAVTTVSPKIVGHHLAVNQDVLAVGGNDLKPNIIFYSDAFTDNFYSATGTCAANADTNGANTVVTTASVFEADMIGGIVYNTTEGVMNYISGWTNAAVPYITTDAATSTWDNDTVYVLQNTFKQDGACTGIVAYQENFVSFDEDNMYIWDPLSEYRRKIPGFGCVNERTVCVVNASLVWVNREGIMMWNGDGLPMCISKKITDDIDGHGIWNLVNPANYGQLAAGTFRGKYYLSVGDLQTLSGAPASAIGNVEIVVDLDRGTTTLNSRDDEPVCYATYINSSGSKDLYYGEKTNVAVYKMNTGTTDDDSDGVAAAFAVEARTPHFSMPNQTVKWRPSAFFVKYKSSATVTLSVSTDRGAYATLKTLSASSSVTVERIEPIANIDAFTHGLKFTTTGTLSIEAVGFEVSALNSFGKPST